jgi:hypothetical protein
MAIVVRFMVEFCAGYLDSPTEVVNKASRFIMAKICDIISIKPRSLLSKTFLFYLSIIILPSTLYGRQLVTAL